MQIGGKKHASKKRKRLETRDVRVIHCTSQTTLSTLLFLQFHVLAIGIPRYASHTAFINALVNEDYSRRSQISKVSLTFSVSPHFLVKRFI